MDSRTAAHVLSQIAAYLELRGETLVNQAIVLRESGKAEEAMAAAREGLSLYEQKGATFFVEKTQRLIDDWTA